MSTARGRGALTRPPTPQELKAEKTMGHFFRFRIMARRLPHFRILSMLDTPADLPALENALSLLPLLPNLRALHISSASAHLLFRNVICLDPDESAPSSLEDLVATPEETDRRTAFRDGVRRLQKVRLVEFDCREAAAVLSCFDDLRWVEISGGTGFSEDLAVCLAGLSRLSHLALETKHLNLTSDWTDPTWASASTLKSLSLSGLGFTPDARAFIETFASSLQTLQIDLHRGPGGAGTQSILDPPIFTVPFPSLTSLFVSRMSMECLQQILVCLAPPPPPSNSTHASPPPSPLVMLDCELSGPEAPANPPPGQTSLTASLRPFASTLHTIRAVRYRRKSKITSVANKLMRFCATRNVHLSSDSRHDPFLYRLGLDEVEEGERAHRVERRCEAMLETIEFGRRYVERMKRSRDFGGTEVGFEVLAQLKALQLLETD